MHASSDRAAIRKIREDAVKDFHFVDGDSIPFGVTFLGQRRTMYTSQLRDLVRRCLKRNPDERPGFLELRIKTLEIFRSLDRVNVFGPFDGLVLPRHLLLSIPQDPFRVGSQAPPRRRRPREPAGDNDNNNDGDDNQPPRQRRRT